VNVFVRDGRVAIYDWGDSSVGFSLWSWLKPSFAVADEGLDPQPLRTAYRRIRVRRQPRHCNGGYAMGKFAHAYPRPQLDAA
jgi:hypothetical protein